VFAPRGSNYLLIRFAGQTVTVFTADSLEDDLVLSLSWRGYASFALFAKIQVFHDTSRGDLWHCGFTHLTRNGPLIPRYLPDAEHERYYLEFQWFNYSVTYLLIRYSIILIIAISSIWWRVIAQSVSKSLRHSWASESRLASMLSQRQDFHVIAFFQKQEPLTWPEEHPCGSWTVLESNIEEGRIPREETRLFIKERSLLFRIPLTLVFGFIAKTRLAITVASLDQTWLIYDYERVEGVFRFN